MKHIKDRNVDIADYPHYGTKQKVSDTYVCSVCEIPDGDLRVETNWVANKNYS
jgi:hypothetical protein